MSAILAGRAARRRAVAYVVLLAISLILMAISASPVVRDVQHGVAFAFKPIEVAIDSVTRDVLSIGTTIAEINDLRRANADLRAENQQLRVENRSATEVRRENDVLSGLIDVRRSLRYDTVPAAVIAQESSEARRVVIVDRGSNDGLRAGEVVVGAGGSLAGRIADVGADFARVILVNDATSTVIGQILGTSATGRVVGQLGGALIMLDVDATAKVKIGEEVFTAGIELANGIRSPYPKGLLIGRVVDVKRDPNEVVQTVYLEPATALDGLEYVLVISDYAGGLTVPTGTPPPCQAAPTTGAGATAAPCQTTTPRPSPSR
jgi:rod shape-determining protein MreC